MTEFLERSSTADGMLADRQVHLVVGFDVEGVARAFEWAALGTGHAIGEHRRRRDTWGSNHLS